jgi:peptidoglycan/LPS O-acetylase OafA/YrhL
VPVPEPFARVLSLVASASLAIYLTHYAVFPVLAEFLPPAPVLVVTLAAGVAAWWALDALACRGRRAGRDRTRSANRGPRRAGRSAGPVDVLRHPRLLHDGPRADPGV